jgi:hypothetical protein
VPTRVLLEGPAIEPLLAQVREEYGSSVRIISADKIRSGGFGGFFAKQRYELSVEVPDDADKPRTTVKERVKRFSTADEPAQTLEQLLERAEARDRVAGTPDERADRGAARKVGRMIDGTAVDAEQLSLTGRGAGMDDTEAAVRAVPPAPGLSTNSSAFADLMAGLDSANAAAASAAAAKEQDEAPAKPTVKPFRPSAANGSAINGAVVKPLPPVPSLAELMGGLGLDDLLPADADKIGVDTAVVEKNSVAKVGTDKADIPTPSRMTRSAAEAYGLTATTGKTPASPTGPSGSTTNGSVGIQSTQVLRYTDPVVANLIRVGMPEPLAATVNGGDTYAGVLTALASRPAAPAVPDAPGEILVLAGQVGHALPIARQILEQIGLEQGHLLLAGPTAAGTGIHSSKVIPGPEEAERRAEKLQNAETAWVVVLDAPVGCTDPTWVRETCDALGATAVWAVVDATRKTADTARHLSMLGDVEALVVHGVDVTSDPATVLGLNLPIVSLDGKAATPHTWAAMLCARIAADVTPAAAPARRPSRGR